MFAETIEYVNYYTSSTGGGGDPPADNLQIRSLTVGNAYKAEIMTDPEDDGAVYVLDQLGVGTTSPSGALHLIGLNGAADRVVFVPGIDLPGGGVPGIRVGLGTAAPEGLLHVRGTDDAQESLLFVPGNNTAAAGVPRIRMGINTAAPQSALHVVGEPDTVSQVMFMPGADTAIAGAPSLSFGIGTPAGIVNGEQLFGHIRWDAATGARVNVQNMSNIGHAQLGLVTNTGFIGYLAAVGSDVINVQCMDKFIAASRLGKDLVLSAEDANSNLLFMTQGTGGIPNQPAMEKMRVTSAGNVGIGITAPAGKLHVVGFTDTHDTASFTSGPDTAAPGVPSMSVGIGTANPQYPLDVNGGFRAAYMWLDNAPNCGIFFRDMNTASSSPDTRAFQIQTDNSRIIFSSWRDVPNYVVRDPSILVLHHNNRVSIGGLDASYTLQVHGSAGKPGGGGWTNPSDRRLKKNIRPLGNALEKLLALRGVQFEWIHPEQHKGEPGTGFVGQEVGKIFPDWELEADASGADAKLLNGSKMKSFYLPTAFQAYVVESIKQLQQEGRRLEERRRRLEKEIETLNREGPI